MQDTNNILSLLEGTKIKMKEQRCREIIDEVISHCGDLLKTKLQTEPLG